MTYSLSRKASEDIANLFLEGHRRFGEKQADAYYKGLTRTFEALVDFPGLARERNELDPPVRIYRYQSHLVVYVITTTGIMIVRVRHGREDWSSVP